MGAGASVLPPDDQVRNVVLEEAASRAPYADPEKQAEAAFAHWDKDHDGYISQFEFQEALNELQIEFDPSTFQQVVGRFDADKDGAVSIQEFMDFIKPSAAFTSQDLYNLYIEFCSFGGSVEKDDMDNSKFAKFARDCKLLDSKSMTPTDVDLIFAKAKPKGQRKIEFGVFEMVVLPMMAEKKFPDESPQDALKSLIKLIAKGAPKSTGTKAAQDQVLDRMTDTSAYTGTHKNRFDDDGQGVGLGDGEIGPGGGQPRRRRSSAGGAATGKQRRGSRRGSATSEELAARAAKLAEEAAGILEAEKDQLVDLSPMDLQNIYIAFCSFGSSLEQDTMDNGKFAKFCRDCGLVDTKTLTPTDVDLVFTKCKEKGQRKIDYRTFNNVALNLLATTKYPDVDVTVGLARIKTMIAKTGTPDASGGTVPVEGAAVGRNTERRGSASRQPVASPRAGEEGGGGDGGGGGSAEEEAAAAAPSSRPRPGSRGVDEIPEPRPRRASLVAAEQAAAIAAVSGRVPTTDQLRQLFTEFCTFGSSVVKDEMDNSKFAKLCRDCKLLGRSLNSTDVDLIFTKMKDKGQRKINFQQFSQVGIPLLAQKKYPDVALEAGCSRVLEDIARGGGPNSSGTVAEDNAAVDRMLDPSNATGVTKNLGVDAPDASQRRASGGGDGRRGSASKARRGSRAGAEAELSPADREAQAEALAAAEALERSQPPPMSKADLHDLYIQFCSFGSSVESDVMDNAKFAKFARDCDLLDRTLTSTDVDLVFTKSKLKGERKINFNQFFGTALPELAAKKYPGVPPGIIATNKLLRVVAGGSPAALDAAGRRKSMGRRGSRSERRPSTDGVADSAVSVAPETLVA